MWVSFSLAGQVEDPQVEGVGFTPPVGHIDESTALGQETLRAALDRWSSPVTNPILDLRAAERSRGDRRGVGTRPRRSAWRPDSPAQSDWARVALSGQLMERLAHRFRV